jgi:cation diffusion facilitator family transporter
VASTTDRYRSIRNVLWIVLFLNLAVASAKLAYGLVSHSAAMEADGFHSMFDGASNVIGLVGMWFASRPADDEHPYGHAKFETFAAAVIGVLLVFAGYTVGRGAIDSLFGRGAPTDVTAASFAIMLGTLAVNVFVTTWERRAGKRLGSEVLVADASHTLSDVAVSIGVIASLVIVKLGFEQADGIVALLVAVIIMRTAWGIMRGVLYTLGDAARLPADEVAGVARTVPDVVDCHAVRTRGSEAHVYVDLHVQVAPHTTIEEGHAIAHQVEAALRREYGQITDVVVHVEPAGQVAASRRGEIDYPEQGSSREAP